MAGTIDDYKVKISVDGTTQVDSAITSVGRLDENVKKINTTLNGFNIRNVAYQIQDIAVQAEMGTSAFRIFTQQAPQLLSAFGTVGAVVGAVAAVSLPLLQYGLKLAGYDARSLTERITGLTQASDEYKRAQTANLTTVEGLRYAFGSLSEEAKKFYEVQQALTKKQAYSELAASLTEADSKFKIFRQETEKPFRSMGDTMQLGSLGEDLYRWWKRVDLGLTAEQAQHIGEAMKDIDKKKPAEAAETLRQISEYIDGSTTISSDFKRTWSETVSPILKINNTILELERNVKAAQEQASAFNKEILDIQNKFQPDINAAKRNFSQLTAIELERKEKIAEVNAQFNQKDLDGVNRTAERKAALLKIDQEASDKVKDYLKGQSEAYNAIVLTNDGKVRQLDLESKILDIQDKGRLNLSYETQYQQDIATNAKTYADTVAQLGEQLRKNVITQGDFAKSVASAANIERQSNELAEQARQKRKADLELQNDLQKNAIAFGLVQQTVALQKSLELEKQSVGLSTIEAERRRSVNELLAKRQQAEFEIRNNIALGEDEQTKRLAIITNQYEQQLQILQEQYKFREQQQKDFGAGAAQRMKEITESFSNFKVAGMMVDSVFNNMNSAIDNFVDRGKFSMRDFTISVINDLIKIQMKAAVVGIFKGIGLGDLFSLPGKAAGGPVSANQPYITGENGPELFIPQTAGTIIPNGAGSGSAIGGAMVTYNINAVDALSFKQMIARDPKFLYAVTQQGAKAIPQTRR